MHEPHRGARQAPALIILAGGQATRLGPLGYGGKPLVSLGDRPALIHQLVQARDLGIKNVAIVTPPGAVGKRIMKVARRVAGVQVVNVSQDRPLGPAHAVLIGSHEVLSRWKNQTAIVIMADTIIDTEDMKSLLRQTASVAAVHRTSEHRPWCSVDPRSGTWIDGVFPKPGNGLVVAVGAYHIDTQAVVSWGKNAANERKAGAEMLMAPLLNHLRARTVAAMNWQDVGDIGAVIKARTQRAVSRPHHNISVDRYGYVSKKGDVQGEMFAYKDLSDIAPEIMPDIQLLSPTEIRMRHATGISLAELLLYHDVPAATWKQIVSHVIDTVDETLWQRKGSRIPTEADWMERCEYMYWTKLEERFHAWADELKSFNRLIINDDEYAAGADVIDRVGLELTKAREVEYEMCCVPVHGDLNFMNIFVDLQSGRVTLIDPRPKWGNSGREDRYGDLAYEIAKLQYSYMDGFCAISHDLHKIFIEGNKVKLKIPNTMDIGDPVGEPPSPQTALLRAAILLSAMPLHTPNQARALYVRGILEANAGLSW